MTGCTLETYAVEHKAELRRALGWRDREEDPRLRVRLVMARKKTGLWLIDGNCERWLGANRAEAALTLEALVAEVPDIHTQLGAPGSDNSAADPRPGGGA